MRRIKIEFAYDGKDFFGFQCLKNKRTIQETLESALSNLLGENIKIVASGRTDAGVSALCQVAHFDTASTIIASNICFAVNKILPKDIQVFSSKEVSPNFHARFSAKSKTYRYLVYQSQHINPGYENCMQRVDREIHLDLMREASKYLLGRHNFKAFATRDDSVKNFEREIKSISINQYENVFSFEITGNAFLYNMVRIIVGSLIDVGTGKKPPISIKEILDSKDRKNAGKLVDGKGLCLIKVCY